MTTGKDWDKQEDCNKEIDFLSRVDPQHHNRTIRRPLGTLDANARQLRHSAPLQNQPTTSLISEGYHDSIARPRIPSQDMYSNYEQTRSSNTNAYIDEDSLQVSRNYKGPQYSHLNRVSQIALAQNAPNNLIMDAQYVEALLTEKGPEYRGHIKSRVQAQRLKSAYMQLNNKATNAVLDGFPSDDDGQAELVHQLYDAMVTNLDNAFDSKRKARADELPGAKKPSRSKRSSEKVPTGSKRKLSMDNGERPMEEGGDLVLNSSLAETSDQAVVLASSPLVDSYAVERIKNMHPIELEVMAWDLLSTIRLAHLQEVSIPRWSKQYNMKSYATFTARFDSVVASLETSKALVINLFEADFLTRLAIDPHNELQRKKSNKKTNDQRNDEVSFAKKMMPSERKTGALIGNRQEAIANNSSNAAASPAADFATAVNQNQLDSHSSKRQRIVTLKVQPMALSAITGKDLAANRTEEQSKAASPKISLGNGGIHASVGTAHFYPDTSHGEMSNDEPQNGAIDPQLYSHADIPNRGLHPGLQRNAMKAHPYEYHGMPKYMRGDGYYQPQRQAPAFSSVTRNHFEGLQNTYASSGVFHGLTQEQTHRPEELSEGNVNSNAARFTQDLSPGREASILQEAMEMEDERDLRLLQPVVEWNAAFDREQAQVNAARDTANKAGACAPPQVVDENGEELDYHNQIREDLRRDCLDDSRVNNHSNHEDPLHRAMEREDYLQPFENMSRRELDDILDSYEPYNHERQ